MSRGNLFNTLDSIVDEIFLDDEKEHFSPVFLLSQERIRKILSNYEDYEYIFDTEGFIDYWTNAIIKGYRCGVYNTAVKVLNTKHGKINSFKKGQEEERQQQIQQFEARFEKLLTQRQIGITS